jgi:DNA invertase Pin-like site-specific DNA recombinase
MPEILAAVYARVSSDQQAEAHTIGSQIAALRARVAEDGLVVPAAREFLDDGFSGATLVRPALERLRDLVAEGAIDRVYVHSPDRLARKYAYQALLLDEFQSAGVAVVFLNRALTQSPEDELLLQVQGMLAEYERAKILERSRRGKRHGAHLGNVAVLSGAPFGYRYIRKDEGGGTARYEIVLDEARVVRQAFHWVGLERASIGEVCRRLNAAGERTRTGHGWERSVVWAMLKNPAYQGSAAFGKTQAGPLGSRLRAQRGRALQPRRPVATRDVPPENWLTIPVPALVDAALLLPSRSSWRPIAAMHGRANVAHATCCRGWSPVASVGTPTTAKRSACAPAAGTHGTMRTIVVWERMRTDSEACGFALTRKCAQIGWTRPPGTRSASCSKSRIAWNRSPASDSSRLRSRPRTKPPSTSNATNCARGWRA